MLLTDEPIEGRVELVADHGHEFLLGLQGSLKLLNEELVGPGTPRALVCSQLVPDFKMTVGGLQLDFENGLTHQYQAPRQDMQQSGQSRTGRGMSSPGHPPLQVCCCALALGQGDKVSVHDRGRKHHLHSQARAD